jgi:outer membrane protein assembly factor BamB
MTNREGTVFALEADTGGRRWSTDLEVGITAAPVAAGDTVLIGTEDGTVSGLDTNSGAVTWQFNTGSQIIGSPIVAGTTMYVVSGDGTLYAVTMTP